jgi:hypothetical protein
LTSFDAQVAHIKPDKLLALVLFQQRPGSAEGEEILKVFQKMGIDDGQWTALAGSQPTIHILRLEPALVDDVILKLIANGFTRLKALYPANPQGP